MKWLHRKKKYESQLPANKNDEWQNYKNYKN